MLIDNIISQANLEKQDYRIFMCKLNGELSKYGEITKFCTNRKLSKRFRGYDSFSFDVNIDSEAKQFFTSEIFKNKFLFKIRKGEDYIATYVSQNPTISFEGDIEKVSINGLSEEVTLSQKKFYLTEGVFKLYTQTEGEKGILNEVLKNNKKWTVGHIDNELINKERYFDIIDTNVYDLLTNSVEERYGCVFEYDTINHIINVYSLDSFGLSDRTSNLIITHDNMTKNYDVEIGNESVITKLHVYGDSGLDIRDVNLGQDYLIDLTYFMSTDYMSQSLLDALIAYNLLVTQSRETYAEYLTTLNTLNLSLINLNSSLLIAQGELDNLRVRQSYLMSLNESIVDINNQIAQKQAEIASIKGNIISVEGSISGTQDDIDILVGQLDMSVNFTEAQLIELDNFMIEETYQDSSYAVTENMSYTDIVSMKEQLLSAGREALSKNSYPYVKISLSLIDFLKDKEFAPVWDSLVMGDTIPFQEKNGNVIGLRLLGYDHEIDSNSLTLEISNAYKLDNPTEDLLDLIRDGINAGTTINFQKDKFTEYDQDKNEIRDFITGSLDINKNKVVGGIGQSMQFDSSGLLMTQVNPDTGVVSPEQLKIVNNSIVLSDDGFETAKTAIGRLANGMYGIAAEILAGNIVVSNVLKIVNSAGDFRIDEDGITVNKMAMNMFSDDNLKNILIDPSVGFKIRSRTNVSNPFTDSLYFDANTKRLKLSGDLEGAGGTFSGTVSASNIIGGSITGTTITGTTISGGNISGTSVSGSTFIGGSITIGSGATPVNIRQNGQRGEISFGSVNDFTIYGGNSQWLCLNLSGNTGFILDGYFRSVDILGNDIKFQSVPRVGGSDLALESYVDSRDSYYWSQAQSTFLTYYSALSTFIQRGSNVSKIGAGTGALFVQMNDGTTRTILFDD